MSLALALRSDGRTRTYGKGFEAQYHRTRRLQDSCRGNSKLGEVLDINELRDSAGFEVGSRRCLLMSTDSWMRPWIRGLKSCSGVL
ncbi:hypothetical protein BCR37DRAFT_376585 [Protomyces lactucae-debilis]|uniref:Uncharacterized protein n=1 Tax=Protomyces lactucae-debilis TaxID=2754530 RepID=A0A1Y2FT66_PROLT|nr:uncharacterized protein BCR37DRAFT_376585 [Protomyces lactucae-debilis]ORY87168.1 hypothetical protein BCR37DRAFT_376585 [Protomyces lactucae-debilis]